MKIGDKLRRLIKTKYRSNKAFSEEIDVNYTQLSQYLNNSVTPSVDFLFKVIKKFPEADLNWLLREDAPVSKENILIDSSNDDVNPSNTREMIEMVEQLLSQTKRNLPQN